MAYTVPRGTKDILPEDVHFWHEIEQVCRNLFDLYNFHEIRTPIFETTDLFCKSIGCNTDIVEKEMYTFKDKGDRSLTLRPEGTAPIVRAYIQNQLYQQKTDTKLYYCGPMFRYERPQAGRFRQFHQIGVEHIGNPTPLSDANVIALSIHIFEELGLPDLSVSINSVGCPTCRSVIEERIKQFLGTSLEYLCKDCNRRFNEQPLRLLDCKNKKCDAYLSGMPDIRSSHCQECRDHFDAVLEYLDSLGVQFIVNPRLVRGLDYYTRTTFEIVSQKLGAQNAIFGGGRYDHLIEKLGGPPTPAVGFAFGLERAIIVLRDLVDTQQTPLSLYIIPLGNPQRIKCFDLLNELRRLGIKCEISTKKNLKTALKEAHILNAKKSFIYGEEEAENRKGLLKDMQTRTQTEISIKRLIQLFKTEKND